MRGRTGLTWGPRGDSVDLGTEPPLRVGGEEDDAPVKRNVSIRWLFGTILTGLASTFLMGGALMAALNNPNQFASRPTPVVAPLPPPPLVAAVPEVPAYVERFDHEVATDAPTMFGEVLADRRSGSPLLLVAGVVVVLLSLAGIYLFNRVGGTASASQGPAPLELTSLAHERSGESLKISGLVHNPRAGRAYSDVAAVVFTFDRQGNYLSSGRSGLDFRQLPPGEESPFSITLPSAGAVARYRVSFRTDEAVIPHLDRRNPPARERGTEP